jgi:hypothetical protein
MISKQDIEILKWIVLNPADRCKAGCSLFCITKCILTKISEMYPLKYGDICKLSNREQRVHVAKIILRSISIKYDK